jgi:hypothetical protein
MSGEEIRIWAGIALAYIRFSVGRLRSRLGYSQNTYLKWSPMHVLVGV